MAAIFRLDSLSTGTQSLDVALLILGILYVYGAQHSWRSLARDRRDLELDRAASAVGMFITVGVAGASVLLTGAGVVLGLGHDKSPLPMNVSTELVLAVGALVISLIAGAISAGYVLNHLHSKTSVAENPWVVGSAAAQTVAMVLGGIGFVISLLLL